MSLSISHWTTAIFPSFDQEETVTESISREMEQGLDHQWVAGPGGHIPCLTLAIISDRVQKQLIL